ncbi:MAG: hypothetical protein ACK56I_11660, partial [bacterium]
LFILPTLATQEQGFTRSEDRPTSRIDSPCHGDHSKKVFGRDKLELLANRKLERRNGHIDDGDARVAHTNCTAIVRCDLARRSIDPTGEERLVEMR